MRHSHDTASNSGRVQVLRASPAQATPAKYLTARNAAQVYGVHRDFFRKTPELRRVRVVVSARTHLYPVAELDEFFSRHQVG